MLTQVTSTVGISDGRHRWAVMRDAGAESIIVSMSPDSIAAAKDLGLVKKKWRGLTQGTVKLKRN